MLTNVNLYFMITNVNERRKLLMYQEISDAEWEVMRIVWTLEQAYTSDIIAALKEKKDWSESTIKTLIRRLVNK